MGIKIRAPKVKVSAPKAISKAISGTVKSVGQAAGSLAKGDIKGVAQGAQGLIGTAKDLGIDAAKANLGLTTGTLGGLGNLTGIKPLGTLSKDIEREGEKGLDTYGGAAMDIGANLATGGTYGLAQQGLGSLAEGGVGSLVNPKTLQSAALGAAGSYAGIDPNMLKAGMSAAKGDLKGTALQAAGSMGGFDPNMLQSVAKGNLAGAAASAAGIPQNIAGAAQGGIKDLQNRALASAGVSPEMSRDISRFKNKAKEAARHASKFMSPFQKQPKQQASELEQEMQQDQQFQPDRQILPEEMQQFEPSMQRARQEILSQIEPAADQAQDKYREFPLQKGINRLKSKSQKQRFGSSPKKFTKRKV